MNSSELSELAEKIIDELEEAHKLLKKQGEQLEETQARLENSRAANSRLRKQNAALREGLQAGILTFDNVIIVLGTKSKADINSSALVRRLSEARDLMLKSAREEQ